LTKLVRNAPYYVMERFLIHFTGFIYVNKRGQTTLDIDSARAGYARSFFLKLFYDLSRKYTIINIALALRTRRKD